MDREGTGGLEGIRGGENTGKFCTKGPGIYRDGLDVADAGKGLEEPGRGWRE